MEHNVALIVMMIISIILLFVAMVLSAMASTSAKRSCPQDDDTHKYSMYSALVAGLAVFFIAVSLVIYIFRRPVYTRIGMAGERAADMIKGHAEAIHKYAEVAKGKGGRGRKAVVKATSAPYGTVSSDVFYDAE